MCCMSENEREGHDEYSNYILAVFYSLLTIINFLTIQSFSIVKELKPQIESICKDIKVSQHKLTFHLFKYHRG